MEPEKPNRRPKAKKEPTTIDLTAEEASVAEPVRSTDSDNGTDTSPETSFEDKQTAETTASSPPPPPESADAETSPEPMPTEPQPEPIAAPEDTVAQEEEPAPPARSSGPSASTLVAAGIFGGIVALALAGSMQYAGYLPAAEEP